MRTAARASSPDSQPETRHQTRKNVWATQGSPRPGARRVRGSGGPGSPVLGPWHQLRELGPHWGWRVGEMEGGPSSPHPWGPQKGILRGDGVGTGSGTSSAPWSGREGVRPQGGHGVTRVQGPTRAGVRVQHAREGRGGRTRSGGWVGGHVSPGSAPPWPGGLVLTGK